MLVKGKVALVTGGASGIGLACAEEMLKNDIYGVALVDINERSGLAAVDDLRSKYGERRVIFIKANVVNKNEFEDAFKETIKVFKQLDILFNNAGLFDEINYENSLNVNLTGVIHGLRLAIDDYLPKYKSGNDAVIINTASVAGLAPAVGIEIYSTTKFAVIGLTRNFGCDYHYKRTGVKVIAICPAATITPILDIAVKGIFYKDRLPAFIDSYNTRQQTSEQLAQCFMRILGIEDNGSIWGIEEGKETKVKFS